MNLAAHAAALSPRERQAALRKSTVAGSLAMFFIAATTGPFFTKYILDLGASPASIGLLGAIPFLVKPVSLLSPALAGRTRGRRLLWYRLALPHRLVWILVIAAPFLTSAWGGNPLAIVVATVLVSNILNALAEPLWMSWMGDLCPPREGAAYWPMRFSVHGIATVSASFVMSWVFYDLSRWAPLAAAAAKAPLLAAYLPFVLVFGLGVVCGHIDLSIHVRIPDPEEGKLTSAGHLTLPLKDRPFISYSLVLSAWQAASTAIVPFVNVFLLEALGMNFWQISVLAALMQVGALATTPLWSRLGLRFGQKPALTLSLLGSSLVPLCFLLATSGNALAVIGPVYAVAGVLSIGFQASSMNILLSYAPIERRTNYISFYNAATFGAIGLATWGGGYVVEWLRALDGTVLGLSTGDLRFFFLLSAALRLVFMPAVAGLRMGGHEIPAGYVFRQLAFGNPASLLGGIYAFSLARTPKARVRAARWLGRSRSPLATRDLVSALSDEDSRVVAEAARALGRIGDDMGVEALEDSLGHPEATVRGSAAWALGKIGTREALRALLERLEREGDHDVRSAAVAAIAHIKELDGLQHVIPLLRAAESPERRAQLAHGLSLFAGLERALPAAVDAERSGRGTAVREALEEVSGRLRRSVRPLGERCAKRLKDAADKYAGGDTAGALSAIEDVVSDVADVLILSKDVLPSPRRWRLRKAGELEAALLENASLGGLLYFIHSLATGEGEPSDEEVILAALALKRFVDEAVRG